MSYELQVTAEMFIEWVDQLSCLFCFISYCHQPFIADHVDCACGVDNELPGLQSMEHDWLFVVSAIVVTEHVALTV